MSSDSVPDLQLEQAATSAAEEVLRSIYGDDFTGCTVSIESVAGVIREALEPRVAYEQAMTSLHQKGFEAIQLLATPPKDGGSLSPEDLRTLLSDRLDNIHTLAGNILAATAAARAQQPRFGSVEE
jgi:hypothetical protein